MSTPPFQPLISVIVPCYNEERTIGLLLNAIATQTTPQNQIEVIIADGTSTDRTREVIQAFRETTPELDVRIVDNPRRIIPAALNTAMKHSRGEFIIRLDAHCVPLPDYIDRCVQALQSGLGTNVGGVWDIQPFGTDIQAPTSIARSIAAAAAHPLGVGDAFYRYATQPQAVDTVPFGAFHRSLIDRIGGFDETLETNEDYEFNVRVLRSGGRVWLDPSIRSIYYARPDLMALAKQYWRYGFWKARMLQRYATTIRWRQALPPVFVASLLFLMMLSPWFILARWLLFLQIALYTGVLVLAAIPLAWAKKNLFMILGVPLAIMTMHLSWGAGLIAGLIVSVRNQEKQG